MTNETASCLSEVYLMEACRRTGSPEPEGEARQAKIDALSSLIQLPVTGGNTMMVAERMVDEVFSVRGGCDPEAEL